MVSRGVAMESLGGHISHPVVDASNGVGDSGDALLMCICMARACMRCWGLGHAEFVCPAHGRGVVTPSGYVDVSESCQVFQHEVEEEHACHFKVRIRN